MKPGLTSPSTKIAMLMICFGLALPTQASATDFLTGLGAALKELQKANAQSHGSAGSAQAAPMRTAAIGVKTASGSHISGPPNSGTPEGTTAILKASPHISAGAFYIGMPVDEAVANMGSMSAQKISFKFEQLPDHPLLAGMTGSRKNSNDEGRENVTLVFSMYPNTPVVTQIVRTTSYTPSTAPTVGNTVAALRKKYGQESGTIRNTTEMYWLFDYEGHPRQDADLATNCMNSGMNQIEVGLRDNLGNKIGRGYVKTYGARENCFAPIYLLANLQVTRPRNSQHFGDGVYLSGRQTWDSIAGDLVRSLEITVNDAPLDYSAAVATRNAVLRGAEQHEKQQVDSAKKRAPSL